MAFCLISLASTIPNDLHSTHPPVCLPDFGCAFVAWPVRSQRSMGALARASHCAGGHDGLGHYILAGAIWRHRVAAARLVGMGRCVWGDCLAVCKAAIASAG